MRVLIIDPRIAGISGDMLLAALIDLYDNQEKIKKLTNIIEEKLPYCKKINVEIIEQTKKSIKAKKIVTKIEEEINGINSSKIREYFIEVCKEMKLSPETMKFTLETIDELIEAERKIHGEKDHIHLHELASADTFLDIIGTALILEEIGFFKGNIKIYTTPPALGGGYIKMKHGLIAAPAPATLEILAKHKFKCSSTPINEELTTPTGAALLVTLTNNVVDFYPPIKINKIGYGAGSKDFEKIPNVLRIVEGVESNTITRDEIIVLETNLDDITGEIAGYMINKLIEEGALDVTITPSIGKKNRPVYIVRTLTKIEDYHKIAKTLIKETGTLGVRILKTPRIIVKRKIEKVKINLGGREFNIRVKIAYLEEGEILNVKPEYEDLRKIAEELKIPIRRIIREVNAQLIDKVK